MDKIIKEVVTEYITFVENLDHSVKGRILKENKENGVCDYTLQVSHYYKFSENQEVDRPLVEYIDDEKKARDILITYLNLFTGIGVEKNEDY